eukprot:CAMPEP_0202685962 /NCGR_PEP_ID=MMETSP1385-20130828/1757_1 /ASSEMBLY_ACC=CAM_ASM_000861 /TAXON_ID=933848 /ORGANISM="Elphidium margaritaceum" /LENGTH=47 /DNA_ID= /DNA_START= /DNA_END= /DNA_ORIENTATION=
MATFIVFIVLYSIWFFMAVAWDFNGQLLYTTDFNFLDIFYGIAVLIT